MDAIFLKQLKQISENTNSTTTPVYNNNIVIIDGMNLFKRNYMVHKFLDPSGYHCGGSIGSIISVKKIVKTFIPKEIYICWEGHKSTSWRKQIISSYKEGRGFKKLSPFKEFEYELEEPDESLRRQLRDFKELLGCIPIISLEYDGLEADDLIGYLVKKYNDIYKIIVSADKDFLQLVDNNTKCFEPINEQLRDIQYVLNEYRIHPLNFCQCRAFIGDKSDNIEGIKGIAEKSMVKLFPFVSEGEVYHLDHFFKHAENENIGSKTNKYKLCLDAKDRIYKNFEVMNLKNNIADSKEFSIQLQIDNRKKELTYDIEQLSKLFIKYNAQKLFDNIYEWSSTFSYIIGKK